MLLLLLLISTVTEKPYPVDYVDLVEVNHYYDERVQPVFTQLIVYDWNPVESRYDVRTWRFIRRSCQNPFPCRGSYVVRWYDGSSIREVRASLFRETWTQHDPELEAREIVRVEHRTPLRRFYRRN